MINIQTFTDRFEIFDSNRQWMSDTIAITPTHNASLTLAAQLTSLDDKHHIKLSKATRLLLVIVNKTGWWQQNPEKHDLMFNVGVGGWRKSADETGDEYRLNSMLKDKQDSVKTIMGMRLYDGKGSLKTAAVYRFDSNENLTTENCLIDIETGEIHWDSETGIPNEIKPVDASIKQFALGITRSTMVLMAERKKLPMGEARIS